MAVTLIADIIDPEVLAEQTSAKFPDFLVLGNTNLVEVDTTFPLGTPGTQFKMPFWKRIGSYASMPENVALVPGKITTGAEFAIVERAGIALEVADTAQLVSKADPVGEISEQLARRAAEYIDDRVVAGAVRKTPNVKDATGTTYNTGGTMEPNVIVDALINSLGDNHQQLIAGGRVIMHSKVYGDLVKVGAIQNASQSGYDFLKTGIVGVILGMPIHLSDRVTTATVSSVTQYETYIVGPGQVALFYQRGVMVEFDRDILLQTDVIASTMHFAPHLFGWDDVGNALAAQDAKTIKVVKITTK